MDALNTLLTFGVFVMMMTVALLMTAIDKIDKKPVLPFTTHDVCSSTSVSVSPSYSNTIRRVNSVDTINTSV
jgi:hypothetical protein